MSQIIEMAPGSGESVVVMNTFEKYRGYLSSGGPETGTLTTTGANTGLFSTYSPSRSPIRTQIQLTPPSTQTDVIRGVFYNEDGNGDTVLTSFNELWITAYQTLNGVNSQTMNTADSWTYEGNLLLESVDEVFNPVAEDFTTIMALDRTTILDPLSYVRCNMQTPDTDAQATRFSYAETHAGNGEDLNMVYHSEAISCHALLFRMAISETGGLTEDVQAAVVWTDDSFPEVIGSHTQIHRAILYA